MEFILELLYEIFIEGCVEIAGSRKIPKAIRILLLSVPFVILGVFFAMGIAGGMKSGNTFLIVFLSILSAACFALWIYSLFRIITNRPFKK